VVQVRERHQWFAWGGRSQETVAILHWEEPEYCGSGKRETSMVCLRWREPRDSGDPSLRGIKALWGES
jgi:hypothetical protein